MTPDELFPIVNAVPLAGWAALVFLPFWRGTQWITAIILPLLLSTAYVLLLVPGLVQAGGMAGDFTSLEGVKTLLASDGGALVGWIHYLAFDLFVGAWEARDAKRNGVPHLLLVPCLILTFMLGPTGLLLYFIIRTVRNRGLRSID
ncbi:ABA4-like family protein [Parvularcula sp. LCG005]|uniref:ABA4-like family protein n=1 Tax=Parvularcula sp. LCG005 TaxID=3078805 RepID=UPI0029431ED7|nr:ABA4-like family protein [Parvularcula sp. LCG005]WOI53677.1 ABA4-like family protein [Parvularcula sp. LCG005]